MRQPWAGHGMQGDSAVSTVGGLSHRPHLMSSVVFTPVLAEHLRNAFLEGGSDNVIQVPGFTPGEERGPVLVY